MKKIILALTAASLLSFNGKTQTNGLNFDGVGDFVACGNILTASYTKEAWINTNNPAALNNIISGGGGGQHAFWVSSLTGSQLAAGHFTFQEVIDPVVLLANTWYHVAVTYDAPTTTMKLYKNGALVSTNNAVAAHINGNEVTIGEYGGASAFFFGSMDEARIWNRALCQDEIQNNMNCGLNPAGQDGLVALYHFDEGTAGGNNTGITTLTDASGNGNNGTLNGFTLTGPTSNFVTGNVSGTCSAFAPTVLTGTPGGGTVSVTQNVSVSGTYYVAADCGLINRVLPSGASPVSGSITSRVTIDATVQFYSGSPYVQRHYDIEPATNPANATGTITLYYKQVEFDDYNTARGIYPALPASSVDAAGIANLRITQYHGTGTAPGNYSGPAVLIDPVDGNIVWNSVLSRWEVTIDVTGFSGFYAHSTLGGVLPVNLLSFSGISNGLYNKIQWITAGEQNSDYFDLERSTDGVNFRTTTTIPAQNISNNNRYYTYNDLKGNSNIYYYRLKMIDRDGSFNYSAIIRISGKQNSFISVYPNPARETVTVNISDTKWLNTSIRITDMNGRLIKTVNLTSLQQPVDIKRLSPGTYIIKFEDGSFTKFVKQ